MPSDRSAEPTTMVIFGASGDLTKRKLVPAVYSLVREQLLPRVAILGTSRSEISDQAFRDSLREGLNRHARNRPIDPELWDAMQKDIFYHSGGFDDPESFLRLRRRLDEMDRDRGFAGHRLFYLSTPPSVFLPIIKNLGKAGLVDPKARPYARVIIEKPFGTDLETARSLNREVHSFLEERQIFRIDHYLGKETVQNLLVFRFANGIFEPLWNSKYVDHVQITGAETLGVEGRGSYFDQAGILRDMVQNHLLQVLCLAAMEPPVSFDADAVRDEKVKVLKALRPIEPDDLPNRVVRGQYTEGSVLGTNVLGYRQEPGVAVNSRTETFVALKLFIDNWRWAGVPFYLRSAKRMPKRVTEIAIHFKSAPHRLFGRDQVADTHPNVLAVRIQPDEGIAMSIGSKVPGPSFEIAPVTMEFRYASTFGIEAPEAYERLLLDAINGDGTLFIRGDEVEASWRFVTPIHRAWETQSQPQDGGVNAPLSTYDYEAGTWGPDASSKLLESDGRGWRSP